MENGAWKVLFRYFMVFATERINSINPSTELSKLGGVGSFVMLPRGKSASFYSKNPYFCEKETVMPPKTITDINQLDVKKQYSYADYLSWQFNERVELIKGWLYKMSPAPRRLHQKIETALTSMLWSYFKKHTCEVYQSPFDVRLVKNPHEPDQAIQTVVQPDISVICDPAKLDDAGCIGAPDLIVEILSTSTVKKDYNEKFNLYEENGVKEYWLVHPELKTAQIYTLENGVYEEYHTVEKQEETLGSKLFPDLQIAAREVFRE